MSIHYGYNLRNAVQQALGNATKSDLKADAITLKGRITTAAPLGIWGLWNIIYTQFGVTGPNAEKHVTKVKVSFSSQTRKPARFSVEIKGGDRLVRALGPGSVIVPITGNVATQLLIRCKSHMAAMPIIVDAK